MTLTKKDKNEIHEIVSEALIENNKLLQEGIEERISHLPTKDEYYKSEAKLMKELQTIRENTTVMVFHNEENLKKLNNHEKRISKLERITITQ